MTAVKFGPFYPSPWEDFGYDVSNFKGICGHYGKMEEFAALLLSLHKQGTVHFCNIGLLVIVTKGKHDHIMSLLYLGVCLD